MGGGGSDSEVVFKRVLAVHCDTYVFEWAVGDWCTCVFPCVLFCIHV